MKQKQLLRALLAAVCLLVGTSAWGAEDVTIFSYTVSAVPENQSAQVYSFDASGTIGGTCAFNVTATEGNAGYFTTASNITSYNFGTNSAYVKMTLPVGETFKTGDVITITGYCANNSYASRGYYINADNANTGLATTNYPDRDAKANTLTATLTADYNGQNALYIKRNGGGNFMSVSVKRSAVTYSITYKANGGTGEDVVDDNASSVAANTFTYESHAFTGWNTSADGTGTEYEVGASVTSDLTLYAQWVEVTTQADIDFSNPITDGSVAGTVNSMVLSNTTGSHIFELGYTSGDPATTVYGDVLRVGNGTGTVTIPDNQLAGNRDEVVVTFDYYFGHKSGESAGFYLKDANDNIIGGLYYCPYNNTNTTNSFGFTLSNEMMPHAKTSNQTDNTYIYNDSYKTTFELHLNYAQGTMYAIQYSNGVEKQTTNAVALGSNNPLKSFVIQSNYTTDTRRCWFDNLTIQTFKGDYSVESAEYTVNWKVGEEIVKTDTRSGDVGSTISLLASDTETFFVNTKKYSYVSDDSSESIIANDGSTVVTVTCEEVGTFNYSVTTSAGSVIEEGTLYNDETKTISWSKYIEKDGIYYKATDPFRFTVSKDATSKEVSVTASQVTQFVEATSGNWATTSVSDSKLSGGAAYRGVSANGTKTMLTVAETGYYSIEYAVFSTNTNSSFDFSLYKNDASVEENKLATLTVDYSVNYVITSGTKSVDNVYLQAGDKIIAKSGNTTCALDYIAIAKTGPTTISKYGYATFSSTYPVNVDVEGLEAYVVTGNNGSSITTEKITGNVAANTGLILKGNAGTYSLPVVASGTTYKTYNKSSNPKNYLFACDGSFETVNAATTGTNYVLTVQEEKVVFAPIGTTPAPVKAGQAALWLQGESGPAKALALSFGDDVTGIEAVSTVEPQGAKTYYNLQGQRVSEPKQGIYVVDGKKVLVK